MAKKTTLKNKADKLWRKLGKENAVCEICSHYPELKVNYTQLHPHHIVGRRNMTLRWDLRNRCWLCPYHHTFGVKSAHSDPRWFNEYMEKFRKEDNDYLLERKNVLTHLTIEGLEEIIESLSHEQE